MYRPGSPHVPVTPRTHRGRHQEVGDYNEGTADPPVPRQERRFYFIFFPC